MSRLTKAAIVLTGSPAAWVGYMVGTKLAEGAARAEQAQRHGVAVGLTDDQARHVIAVWQAHFRQLPGPVDWERIEAAMVHRALRQEWKP